MIKFFYVDSGEEDRINVGLKYRNLEVADIISVTWNNTKGCYVVWYKSKES